MKTANIESFSVLGTKGCKCIIISALSWATPSYAYYPFPRFTGEETEATGRLCKLLRIVVLMD